MKLIIEAVAQRCSVKKVLLEISQNSQENTCGRVSFLIKLTLAQVFSCEFCEISKNTFFHRPSLVAASVKPIEKKSVDAFRASLSKELQMTMVVMIENVLKSTL